MTREDIKYWLYYYGMPKEFVDNCAEQIERDFKKVPSLPEQPVEGLKEAARHVWESWNGGTMDDVRRDMKVLGNVLNAEQPKVNNDQSIQRRVIYNDPL